MRTPTLSITVGIVLFNNSATELGDLANSLSRAIFRLKEDSVLKPSRVSVRLHNNGDTNIDPTMFGPWARLTSSSCNLGFGRAHNLLMAEAFAQDERADYYLMLNSDGILHPDLLVELMAAARRYEGKALVEASQFPEEQPKPFDPLTFDTPWATGACLLVPAAIYRAIGGFDENIFLYCEDVDFSWRARQAGYFVKHAPRALFFHIWNRSRTNYVLSREHFDAARYIGKKWQSKAFVGQIEQRMAKCGLEPRPLPKQIPLHPVSSIPDFDYGLGFAPPRWRVSDPIPTHAASSGATIDNTIDIIVRFHDITQIRRLSRCLFSLYGQRQQPIQILLMLQNMDASDVLAVEACVNSFDWSAPRRRPRIHNVLTPEAGDHRARLWNAGLAAGHARYLGFVDFDDTVYAAGYSYLLHRLQFTGAAAIFASALYVDCTPMSGFDFVFRKQPSVGRDRYDFFVSGSAPNNTVLVDRSQVAIEDLQADENLSKAEDYIVFVTLAAKYKTDWASIGTVVSDYYHRTDGSNTVLSHRNDPASRQEWTKAFETAQRVVAGLTTQVSVKDLVQMRNVERSQAQQLENLKRRLAQIEGSRSLRLTRPLRVAANWIRRVRTLVER